MERGVEGAWRELQGGIGTFKGVIVVAVDVLALAVNLAHPINYNQTSLTLAACTQTYYYYLIWQFEHGLNARS